MTSEVEKLNKYFRFLYWWSVDRTRTQRLKDTIVGNGFKRIAVYGMGPIGEILVNDLRSVGINVLYAIDRNPDGIFYDIDVYTMEEDFPQTDVIIVTPFLEYGVICEKLARKTNSKTISIIELLLV